jgi:tetratricopeptide (TPR) repeat protein
MSQAQLAGPDLSDSYVSLIESGKRTPTPVVARLLAERLGCTTEFLLHGIEPRQRIDTELGLRHAELELYHGDPATAVERFGEIVKAAGEDNAMLAAQARLGRARALERQGKIGRAVEAYERLRREAAAHPERLADLPLAVALCRCYQRAGDLLRARDLAAHALAQVEQLSLIHGEVAVDLAAVLAETETGLPYVEQVLAANDLPDAVDRTSEITALWRASTAASEREDSALAVRLADDALAAGRPARLAVRIARVAMQWSRVVAAQVGDRPGDLARADELAGRAAKILATFPGESAEHARSLMVLAHVKIQSGDLDGAVDLARRALTQLGDSPGVIAASAQLVFAHVGLARSESDVSGLLAKAQDLLQNAAGVGPDREGARVWRELGDLWGRAGSRHVQFTAYRRALEAVGIRANMPGSTAPAVLTR